MKYVRPGRGGGGINFVWVGTPPTNAAALTQPSAKGGSDIVQQGKSYMHKKGVPWQEGV